MDLQEEELLNKLFSTVDFVEDKTIVAFFDKEGCVITTLHFVKNSKAKRFKTKIDILGVDNLSQFYHSIEKLIEELYEI